MNFSIHTLESYALGYCISKGPLTDPVDGRVHVHARDLQTLITQAVERSVSPACLTADGAVSPFHNSAALLRTEFYQSIDSRDA